MFKLESRGAFIVRFKKSLVELKPEKSRGICSMVEHVYLVQFVVIFSSYLLTSESLFEYHSNTFVFMKIFF